MEDYFSTAHDVNDYKWKDKKNDDFIHRFISIILTLDTEFNPNHYISELSNERQDIILEIGNYLYNKYEINNNESDADGLNESKMIMITSINEFKQHLTQKVNENKYTHCDELTNKVVTISSDTSLSDDGYDINDRPLFISEDEDDIEYTIDSNGDVYKHDGLSDEKIGSVKNV